LFRNTRSKKEDGATLYFLGCRAKFAPASFARTNLAKVFKTEDSRRVPIGKLNLNRVVSDGSRGLGFHSRLEHRQLCATAAGQSSEARFLLAFIVAQGAGTMVAKIRKVVAARMTIRPSDFHALASRDVNLHANRPFPHIDWYWHCDFILTEADLAAGLCALPSAKLAACCNRFRIPRGIIRALDFSKDEAAI